jgi:hypothetical protein
MAGRLSSSIRPGAAVPVVPAASSTHVLIFSPSQPPHPYNEFRETYDDINITYNDMRDVITIANMGMKRASTD